MSIWIPLSVSPSVLISCIFFRIFFCCVTCRHEIHLALCAHAEARHIEEIRGILPIILGCAGVPDSEHAAITKFLQTLELQNMIPRGLRQYAAMFVSPIVNVSMHLTNLASIASPWPLSHPSNMLGMQWIHDGSCWPLLASKSWWHNARRPQTTDSCTATVHGRNSRQKWKAAEAAAALPKDSDIYWHILTFLWHSLAFFGHFCDPCLTALAGFARMVWNVHNLPGGLLFSSRSEASLSLSLTHIYNHIYIYTTPCISTGHCRHHNVMFRVIYV